MHHLEAAHRGFTAIPLPIEVAVVSLYRSSIYRQLNLLEEMMHLARQAGQVFRKQKMRREYIRCLINQGYGYQRLNLLPQAERLLARARRLLYQNEAWGVLRELDSDRAELALLIGRIDTARRVTRRLEKQFTAEQRPSLAARVQLLLARCVLAQQPLDLAKARKYVDKALAIAQTYHLPVYEALAYACLGQILEAHNQAEAAWPHYQRAVQINEQLRTYLLHDEFQTGFMDDKLPIYAANVRLAHKMVAAQKAGNPQLLHALALAQTAPLLHFSHSVADSESVHNEQRTRLVELRQSWHWYQSKLDAPDRADNTSVAESAAWREQLQQIEREMGELMRLNRKTSASPDDPFTQAASTPFPDAIQDRLGSQDTLLHYYEVAGQVQVLLVGRTESQAVPNLVATTTLERLLRTWRFYLHHVSRVEPSSGTAQSCLTRLYQLLIEPLQPYLTGKGRLYLVLPPEWHDIPMAALFDGRHYLVEQFQLLYLSTPTALLASPQPVASLKGEPFHALVVGASDGGRLPHTITEAREVAAALSLQGEATALIEEHATINQFRLMASKSRLLHLAAHALFRPDNPVFSSIHLADGRVTVADLYAMTLPGRPFVVLSACETGRGRPRGGGLLGMGRAFLAAGASGLIATLWPVPDIASAGLMTRFYHLWLASPANLDAGGALSGAQREAIAQGAPPLQWAGFILISG